MSGREDDGTEPAPATEWAEALVAWDMDAALVGLRDALEDRHRPPGERAGLLGEVSVVGRTGRRLTSSEQLVFEHLYDILRLLEHHQARRHKLAAANGLLRDVREGWRRTAAEHTHIGTSTMDQIDTLLGLK